MPPPEIWGPAVWTLFHTLIEKMDEKYPQIIPSTYDVITKICRYLPCPECSNDAGKLLAKMNINDYKTKEEFKNIIYLFHNAVNHKKHKPLFNYANMEQYKYFHLIDVIQRFLSVYNTKGNMRLLTETFHRSFVTKYFLQWFKSNASVFLNVSPQKTLSITNDNEPNKTNISK
jgi:hypothetical protein